MGSSKTDKPKLAVILPRFPYPLEKGDKLRAYYQLRELSDEFSITLFCLTETSISDKQRNSVAEIADEIHVFRLKKWMIFFQLFKTLFSEKPFQVAYFYDPFIKRRIRSKIKDLQPDHIYCQLIRTTEYIKDYHECKKTLDYMDALSKGIDRRIDKAPFGLKWLFRSEARRLRSYEQRIFSYFENLTIISQQDRELILHPDRTKIKCIPNGIDHSFFEYEKSKADFDLVFVGNLSYPPNIDAVQEIDQTIRISGAYTCIVAGATPSVRVKKIASENANMQLLGWTDDVREAYSRGQIFFAPMMIGTGMQNKLLEAMAMGIPCVTTSLAANALNGVHRKTMMIGNNPQEWLECIEELRSNSDLAAQISHNAKKFVMSNYSWEGSVQTLRDLFI